MLKVAYQMSDNSIASIVGVNHSTVRRIREELEARGEIPRVEKVIAKDGIAYEKDRPRSIANLAIEPDPWADSVICGDAFEILPNEPLHSYDLVFVDPPYNISKQDWGEDRAKTRSRRKLEGG